MSYRLLEEFTVGSWWFDTTRSRSSHLHLGDARFAYKVTGVRKVVDGYDFVEVRWFSGEESSFTHSAVSHDRPITEAEAIDMRLAAR